VKNDRKGNLEKKNKGGREARSLGIRLGITTNKNLSVTHKQG